jgi:FMN phosphatase YigB (HAD superfamily)
MIVVFDFDQTLTVVHTGGRPVIGEDYFTGHLAKTKTLLKGYVDHGWKIYVNTRGIKSDIVAYLKSVNLYKYIRKVYGAATIEDLAREDWPMRKVRVLDKISSFNSVSKGDIFFYDDTPENIAMARQYGYKNSHVVVNTNGTLQK